MLIVKMKTYDMGFLKKQSTAKLNSKTRYHCAFFRKYNILESNVHEKMDLEPLTDYSRYKAYCERILNEYQSDDFTTVSIRPATVCGYSLRQRLDVVVNIFLVRAVHAPESVLDDDHHLVGERGIVRNAVGNRAGENVTVPVLMLQTFAIEGGAPGGCAQH